MRKYLPSILIGLILLAGFSFFKNPARQLPPAPTEGDENQKKREQYFELIHRAAPGTDWRMIEQSNDQESRAWRQTYLSNRGARVNDDVFANGQVQGNWEERGSDNQAGNVKAVAYDSLTDNLYVVSAGGSLWKRTLTNGSWTLQNNIFRFRDAVINLVHKPDNSERLLLFANNQVYYTDNEGLTMNASTGISFPVAWGGNTIVAMTAVNDANKSIYCLAYLWDNVPWAPRYWLYRSTDLGQTFTKIHTFDHGTDGQLSMTKMYNTNQVYFLDGKSVTGNIVLSTVNGATVTTINSVPNSESGKKCILKATYAGGAAVFYALFENKRLYQSINDGATWTLQSTLTETAWDRLEVSNEDPQKVYYGGVDAYRSLNGGLSFTKVNVWSEYYANPQSKLHADIMEIAHFRKAGGSSFLIINNHGGCYVSTDGMVTNTNLSMSGLRTAQYYDVITDQRQPNRLFAGSQDQGFQRNLTATTPGVLEFTQVISGDYGYLALTGTPHHLWTQYPGGALYYYDNPTGGLSSTWTMPGSQLPNYGWMIPVVNTAFSETENEVWMAGGNTSGGTGSYLSKLKASTSAPFAINATQLAYNFRANSNTGNGGITAVEASRIDPNRIYVATEDGAFFTTSDAGGSWTKTASFNGPTPWYLYGSSIYSSRFNPNLVWLAGSGYSNPPVYKSTNGGQSFTSISTGLPSTLVYEIVANPDETLLFAATEAGPYVYVVADNQWYSMTSAINPTQSYVTVEYIQSSNTVRFGTYGMGIWDFKLSNALPAAPVVTTTGSAIFCQGGTITLTSSASSGNQWYKNGSVIAGATANTYQATETGYYTVKTTVNSVTSYASSPLYVQVTALPPTPTISFTGATNFCQGGSLTLNSSSATGNQWYRDNVVITGATNTSLTVTNGGSYTVRVNAGTCFSPVSNAVAITVNAVPTQPTITQVGTSLQSSSASGNQWYTNGNPIAGATGQTYTPPASGNFSVQVTSNGCTSPMSSDFNFLITAINSPVLERNIKIWPNPAVNDLFITYQNNTHPMELRVYALNGMAVSGPMNFTSRIDIDTRGWARGAYVIVIRDKKTNEQLRKMISNQ